MLTNRVDGLGVSGATVVTQGGDIVVQIPGVKNARQVLKTIGQTAQLLFRPGALLRPRLQPGDQEGGKRSQGGKLPLPLPRARPSTS